MVQKTVPTKTARSPLAPLLVFIGVVCAAFYSVDSLAFGSVHFERTPFAEGNFKYAFWGKVTDGNSPGYEEGTKIILKTMKPDRKKKGYRITEAEIKAQLKAARIAKLFTAEVNPKKKGQPCHVYMRVGKLGYAETDGKLPNGTVIFRRGEPYIAELPIYGKFQKFNSNTGWSSGFGTLPDALSHWSWVRTDGDVLICDMQGHRGDPSGPPYGGKKGYYYCLTDPAIISKNMQYGSTDLGKKGIETWFKWHKCNSFCIRLGLHEKRPCEFEMGHIQVSNSSEHRQQGMELADPNRITVATIAGGKKES